MSEDKRIWVERKALGTVAHVRDWPSRTHGFLICSSNESYGARGLTGGTWKNADRAKIGERLGSRGRGLLSGEQKGRVLYAFNYYLLPSRWEAVGALLFTVPQRKSRHLTVFRICLEQSLSDRDKRTATALLLLAARQVGEESGRGRGKIRWEVDPRDSRVLCGLYGFRRCGTHRQFDVLESV
jgi:hypothetical protein